MGSGRCEVMSDVESRGEWEGAKIEGCLRGMGEGGKWEVKREPILHVAGLCDN